MENSMQFQNQKKGNLVHVNDVLMSATQPVRKYQQQVSKATYVPKKARFKLKFYFLDGNSFTCYSYDTEPRYENGVKTIVKDESIGLLKLFRCINSDKFKGKFLTAIIWCKKSDDTSTEINDYNFTVAKFVRNCPEKIHRRIKFTNGILDWKDLTINNF